MVVCLLLCVSALCTVHLSCLYLVVFHVCLLAFVSVCCLLIVQLYIYIYIYMWVVFSVVASCAVGVHIVGITLANRSASRNCSSSSKAVSLLHCSCDLLGWIIGIH